MVEVATMYRKFEQDYSKLDLSLDDHYDERSRCLDWHMPCISLTLTETIYELVLLVKQTV